MPIARDNSKPGGVFAKLQLKDQKDILVLDAPSSFEAELARLKGVTVHRSITGMDEVPFALVFVKTQGEVDEAARAVLPRAQGDAVVWFAYPKGSSTRYTSTIHRDTGWSSLGAAGFEGVRMIAIDEDWSAVRFRRAEYIRTMTRDAKRAMSAAGKARAARKR